MRRLQDKIVSVKRLQDILQRRGKKKVVFTNGCFDILHYGHVYYLENARLLGDMLVVGVNSDESVRALKGKSRPINSLKDRMRVLAGLESVDYVVSFSQETPLRLIKSLKPDVLVKGGDWDVKNIVGSKDVLACGGVVKTIPIAKGRSTTNIINVAKMKGGKI